MALELAIGHLLGLKGTFFDMSYPLGMPFFVKIVKFT